MAKSKISSVGWMPIEGILFMSGCCAYNTLRNSPCQSKQPHVITAPFIMHNLSSGDNLPRKLYFPFISVCVRVWEQYIINFKASDYMLIVFIQICYGIVFIWWWRIRTQLNSRATWYVDHGRIGRIRFETFRLRSAQ